MGVPHHTQKKSSLVYRKMRTLTNAKVGNVLINLELFRIHPDLCQCVGLRRKAPFPIPPPPCKSTAKIKNAQGTSGVNVRVQTPSSAPWTRRHRLHTAFDEPTVCGIQQLSGNMLPQSLEAATRNAEHSPTQHAPSAPHQAQPRTDGARRQLVAGQRSQQRIKYFRTISDRRKFHVSVGPCH